MFSSAYWVVLVGAGIMENSRSPNWHHIQHPPAHHALLGSDKFHGPLQRIKINLSNDSSTKLNI